MKVILKLRFFLTFLVFVWVSGCAVMPDQIPKTERKEEIRLTEKIAVPSEVGLLRFKQEIGAMPGRYKAEWEDAAGVYYFGSERCVWLWHEASQKKPRLFMGGIYLPKNEKDDPKLFYIFEKEEHVTENINQYISDRTINSLTIPQYNGPGVAAGSAAGIAGNVIGGLMVYAIIESSVGGVEFMAPSISAPDLKARMYSSIVKVE